MSLQSLVSGLQAEIAKKWELTKVISTISACKQSIKFKAGAKKCCKKEKITFTPNEWCNIPFANGSGLKFKLTHSMGTRQIELKGIWASLSRHFGQSLPIVLVVAAHDACNHHWVQNSTTVLQQLYWNVKKVSCYLYIDRVPYFH